jgi:nucleoside-diphosphate-sugar epimerase
MPEAVLVTGGTGFIGRRLVSALQDSGCQVHVLSSRDGDIAESPLPAPNDISHVYHLAARSFVPESWKDPHAFYKTNVLGTATVLEFCRQTGASLTFVSSYVYGQPKYLPIDEEHPLQAVSPYSQTKIWGEELVRFYADQFGVNATIIRPFNIYGPGQNSSFLIPVILQQALSDERDVIEVADDRPARDYLYVDDLIDLLLRVRSARCGTYNAGSGTSVSVAAVIEQVNHLLPKPKPLVSRSQERRAEVMDVVADTSKVRAELGWLPRTSLLDGLQLTIKALNYLADVRSRS